MEGYSALDSSQPQPTDSPDKRLDNGYTAGTEEGALQRTTTFGQKEYMAVVQFSCAQYYTKEGEEEEVLIDVVRLGDLSRGDVEFAYRTEDASAKAGTKYQAVSGTMHFEPGEGLKTISVPIINNTTWEATLEFRLVLTAVRGARMGKYLHHCRVKIIDNDYFPTNMYGEAFKTEDGSDEIDVPGNVLMMEFCKFIYRDENLWRKTVQCLLLDQITGVYFFLTLYLQMYLVDVVLAFHGGEDAVEHSEAEAADERRLLKQGFLAAGRMAARMLTGEEVGAESETGEEEEHVGFMIESLLVPGSRKYTSMVVAALYVVPFLFVHLSEVLKCKIQLAGHVRRLLQASLLQRFLHYREEKRVLVNTTQFSMLIVRDVDEVVDCGYMKILGVIKIVGKLLLALVFVLAENRMAAIPLIVFPIVLGCFLRWRERMTIRVNEARVKKLNDMVQCVSDAINKYRHIADFHMQSVYVDRYTSTVHELNQCDAISNEVFTNNSFMAPWLTTLLIGAYIIFAASKTESAVRIGLILASINVFKEMGVEIQEIYCECLEVQKSFGALLQLSYFMNMETDLEMRMQVNRQRRRDGKRLRDERLRSKQTLTDENVLSPTGGAFLVDKIDIQVDIDEFSYSKSLHPQVVLRDVHLTLPQGKLYAVVGPPHMGKGTLLKLIGQVLVPSPEGAGGKKTSIFVPPHLRILHLSRHCSLMPGTFMDNVVLNTDLKKVGGLERVANICEAVGFGAYYVRSLLEESQDTTKWCAQLSDSDYERLALLRAYVMNPEVLVVHKPSATFTEKCSDKIVRLLKQHVDERGLFLPEPERKFRRPRTVFFTAHSLKSLDQVDEFVEVAGGTAKITAKQHVNDSTFA